MFNLIGSPETLPAIVGYDNLSDEQKEEVADQGYGSAEDFGDPKGQPFWVWKESLWFEEADLSPLQPLLGLSILYGSEYEYGLTLGNLLYAVKFNRDRRGLPVSVVIHEVSRLDFVLPEVLSDYEAGQLVEKLSRHKYGGDFEAEPKSVSTVIRDLAVYSDLTDEDFELEFTEAHIRLDELFHRIRNCKDEGLRALLDEFFSVSFNRTL
jgi:hypothetical protein